VPVALAGGLLAQPTYRAAVRKALDQLTGVVTTDRPVEPVEGALDIGRRTAAG